MTNQTQPVVVTVVVTQPVVVSTEAGGVIFGYTTDVTARPIILTNSRVCLYWGTSTGGMWGLAEQGPNDECRISAQVTGNVYLEGVVSILGADEQAAIAWGSAKVEGR